MARPCCAGAVPPGLRPAAPASCLARTHRAPGEGYFCLAEMETGLSLGFCWHFICISFCWRAASAGGRSGWPREGGAGSAQRDGRGEAVGSRLGGSGEAPLLAIGAVPIPALVARTAPVQWVCSGGQRTKTGMPGDEQPQSRFLETRAAASCSTQFKICIAVPKTPKISARKMSWDRAFPFVSRNSL